MTNESGGLSDMANEFRAQGLQVIVIQQIHCESGKSWANAIHLGGDEVVDKDKVTAIIHAMQSKGFFTMEKTTSSKHSHVVKWISGSKYHMQRGCFTRYREWFHDAPSTDFLLFQCSCDTALTPSIFGEGSVRWMKTFQTETHSFVVAVCFFSPMSINLIKQEMYKNTNNKIELVEHFLDQTILNIEYIYALFTRIVLKSTLVTKIEMFGEITEIPNFQICEKLNEYLNKFNFFIQTKKLYTKDAPLHICFLRGCELENADPKCTYIRNKLFIKAMTIMQYLTDLDDESLKTTCSSTKLTPSTWYSFPSKYDSIKNILRDNVIEYRENTVTKWIEKYNHDVESAVFKSSFGIRADHIDANKFEVKRLFDMITPNEDASWSGQPQEIVHIDDKFEKTGVREEYGEGGAGGFRPLVSLSPAPSVGSSVSTNGGRDNGKRPQSVLLSSSVEELAKRYKTDDGFKTLLKEMQESQTECEKKKVELEAAMAEMREKNRKITELLQRGNLGPN